MQFVNPLPTKDILHCPWLYPMYVFFAHMRLSWLYFHICWIEKKALDHSIFIYGFPIVATATRRLDQRTWPQSKTLETLEPIVQTPSQGFRIEFCAKDAQSASLQIEKIRKPICEILLFKNTKSLCKMSSKVAQAYPSNQAELQGQQDFLQEWIEGPREFIKESIYLVNRCTKPDRRGSLSLGFFV